MLRRWITRTLPVLVVGLSLSVLAPQAAFAAKPVAAAPAAPTVGNDVSWPQCGKRLPTSTAFAIVGVNGGLANDWNPCFLDQLAWAHRSVPAGSAGKVALYVNTANAAGAASWWPTGDTTKNGTPVTGSPYGSCTGPANYGPACAFVYGYSFAVEDVARLRSLGVRVEDYPFWLDVETMNTWQKDTRANAAVLEGMTAYFTEKIGLRVGIYSTGYQWNLIAGTTPPGSSLYSLPSWLAGSSSERDARSDCRLPPLTGGGTVEMTQYVAKQLDYNVACR
jgi:hypothetical protein